ncbi:MAG: hypothetical protein O3B42_01585 [Actinomycetota bacterium]|nr:hypothetical protein [Actinomycetota bacterium]
MESWNDDSRVRPIPVEDETISSSGPVTRSQSASDGPKRPWLPIVVSGIAVAIVLGSVAVFGSVQDTDPPPLDPSAFASRTEAVEETTTTTLGPTLSETIPGIKDRLTLVVDGPNGPAVLLWDPTFVVPKELSLIANGTGDSASSGDAGYSVSFDSGGRFMALEVHGLRSPDSSLYLGIPTNVGGLDLVGVQSYRWHATEVGRIAWVQHRPGNQPTLSTASVDQLKKTVVDSSPLAEIDEGDSLVRWDRDGFVLNTADGQVVWRDPAGVEQSRIEGVAVAVGTTVMVLAPPQMNPSLLSSAQLFGRDGTPGATALDAPLPPGISLRTFAISRTSDLVARIDVSSLGTRLQVSGPSLSSIHLLDNQDDLTALGFTANDEFFVFERLRTNDLVFVDWDLGTVQELNIPDQYTVVALDIG